jgi:hypothetical protein
MVNKDGQLLQEAYLSALQKSTNILSKFEPKQPDSPDEAENYEDRMQGVSDNTQTDEQPQFNDVVATVIQTQEPLSCSEEDEASRMVKSNLYTIYKSAYALFNIVKSGHTLDYWMNEKLAICAEHLTNIHNVAEYDFLDKNCENNKINIQVTTP